MEKIRAYYIEIVDTNNQKHQLKSLDHDEILKFARRHRGKINGVNKGSVILSEHKLREMGLLK